MSYLNKAIGGFFEIELNDLGSVYHDGALALNSGRNSLEYILLNRNIKHIFIPYYTCEVILEPILKHGIKYSFYHIDNNFLPIIDNYIFESAILYTNYFGLMGEQAKILAGKYPNLILDNAQAFYDMPLEDVPTFYSPRKFFGLPDGGFVYDKRNFSGELYPIDISIDKISHLIERVEYGAEYGFTSFKENDNKLSAQPIKTMSNFTHKLMRGIDYDAIKNKRLENFYYLHDFLKGQNEITHLIDASTIVCPMVYPFLNTNKVNLRNKLIENKIFVARYWPNVLEWTTPEMIENIITKYLIPLPVDQRISIQILKYMSKLIR